MIILILIILGLCLGSFINALIWRIHAQDTYKNDDGSWKKLTTSDKKQLKLLSISTGRSMCLHCGHVLAPKDLIPVLSWLWLRGKCRYCREPIDDTPIAEILLPVLLVLSYTFWPHAVNGWSLLSVLMFVLWVGILVCFVALALYDAKWYLLPDRIVLPLSILAAGIPLLLSVDQQSLMPVGLAVLGAISISGLFFVLSYASKGAWIGGGDVKLGIPLGLLAGNPLMAFALIFLASVIGIISMIPGIVTGRKSFGSMLPFGPYLIAAGIVIFLGGEVILGWYTSLLIS